MAAAALCGVAFAFVLNVRSQPDYEFLAGARRAAGSFGSTSRGAIDDGADSTGQAYVIGQDLPEVVRRAKKEFPQAFESTETLNGAPVAVLTVPRMEGSRVSLLYPPQRVIRVLAGSHASSVEVREYRIPSMLENAMTWFRHILNV